MIVCQPYQCVVCTTGSYAVSGTANASAAARTRELMCGGRRRDLAGHLFGSSELKAELDRLPAIPGDE